ncbi:Hypothetical protein FKW44_010208 [Caligus rogercresseyi]|uniref:Uncharacterized protein n=1 Tax=Caligus rogercresseyi TaxID=217165 RepID=A0A7T8HGE0_CALRO|nr:Hypothetical protein FKW44_010208 [Caligus rogercresseyi]
MVISGEDPDLTLLLGCERPERPPQPEGGTLLVLQSHSVEIKRIKRKLQKCGKF